MQNKNETTQKFKTNPHAHLVVFFVCVRVRARKHNLSWMKIVCEKAVELVSLLKLNLNTCTLAKHRFRKEA